MPSEGDIILEGSRNHIEAGLGQYLSLCGRSFDPAEVERVELTVDGWERSHELFCFDCHSVQNRRAVEGSGEVI